MSRAHRTSQVGAVLAAALLAVGAAPAAAQDGVFVDPESPTAKEYAVPLDDARRTGAGAKKHPGGGTAEPGTAAPRFGEGVGDDQAAVGGAGGATSGPGGSGGSGSGGPGSGSGSGDGGGAPAPSTPGSGGSETPASSAVAASRPGAPDGGGLGTMLVVIAAGSGLLLAGTAAGYALRRRPGAGAPASE